MTKKQKLIIQIVVLMLILILAIRPMAAGLGQNLATKKQLTKRLVQLEGKLNTLNGIEPLLIDDRVKKMEAVFPSVKPIVPLMASLSQLAAQQNLTFGGVSLSPGSLSQGEAKSKDKKKTATDLNDLRFGFQIGGDFDSISKFMRSLENTAPLMKIEEVGLTIKTNPLFERTETIVVADIKVAAYYQPPPKTLGGVDKPVKLLSRSEEILLNQLVSFKTFPQVVPQTTVGKEDLFGVQPKLPGPADWF
ncbi:hypothetical protein A3E73_02000 [Candidatus Beckwithbacteria bacterium RIFCSPHIGHO2_12_FULL_47_17]|uniref:Uncharacterized protein n=1 Tax=Candidatus Beckwithbacteria bacterium RIFCSPHIGHO2_12_FULL_47_17 TaxID=1797460 RepID=A0A1F5DNK8_9BACT|nr:MAG: hypothetical protein A3E73_02000 [Candidatus Beckwithbacteria bacterium RIFCSPHIGHO2_12_FULL_47_17]